MHPHIAAVYDVGEQDGIDYIVMECVAGESLAAKVKRGRLVVEEATSIALDREVFDPLKVAFFGRGRITGHREVTHYRCIRMPAGNRRTRTKVELREPPTANAD
jgi:serine/threonine protein kinase